MKIHQEKNGFIIVNTGRAKILFKNDLSNEPQNAIAQIEDFGDQKSLYYRNSIDNDTFVKIKQEYPNHVFIECTKIVMYYDY